MHSNNNFQAESTRSGNDFEDLVLQDLTNRGFTIISRNVYFEEIGCEFDFVSQNNYIEAKGGFEGKGKRPGAKRTDNVKKAIANCALLSTLDINPYTVIYFSSKPKSGSSSELMIQAAIKAGFVSEVRYLEQETND